MKRIFWDGMYYGTIIGVFLSFGCLAFGLSYSSAQETTLGPATLPIDPNMSVIPCTPTGCVIVTDHNTILGNSGSGTITNLVARCPADYQFVMTNSGPRCARDLIEPEWK